VQTLRAIDLRLPLRARGTQRHARQTTAIQTERAISDVRAWGRVPDDRRTNVRVRVKIMGLIIIRTDRDFPTTFLHFGDPVISTRTRSVAWHAPAAPRRPQRAVCLPSCWTVPRPASATPWPRIDTVAERGLRHLQRPPLLVL
jgi:hypothetical protein